MIDYRHIKEFIEKLDPGIQIIEGRMQGADRISGFSSLHNSKPNTVTWSRKPDINWQSLAAAVVIAPPGSAPPPGLACAVFLTSNPRFLYQQLSDKIFYVPPLPGVHPTAIIDLGCTIGKNVSIGPNCVISAGSKIDDNSILHAGVVFMAPNVKIGKNCILHANVVIGGDGIGYEKDENGQWCKIRHFGSVTVGNNTEIGAGTAVARGAIDNTVIGDNCKIDTLVLIGHNVTIGNNNIIVTNAQLLGSSRLGSNCWISAGAIVRGSVGDGVTIGMGTVSHKDVEPGQTIKGPYGQPWVRRA